MTGYKQRGKIFVIQLLLVNLLIPLAFIPQPRFFLIVPCFEGFSERLDGLAIGRVVSIGSKMLVKFFRYFL